MTEPDDRELDQYLAGQHRLSQRYREATQSEQPPPELDDAILGAARAATPAKRRSVRRWAVPFGLAASLMIGGPLVWQVWQTDESHNADFAYRASSPVAVMAEQAERAPAPETRDAEVKAEKQAMARAESQAALSQRQAPPRALATAPPLPAPPSATFSSPNMAEDQLAAQADTEPEDPPTRPFIGFGPAMFGDDEESVRIAWGRPLTVQGNEPEACRQLFAEPQSAFGISFMLVNGRFARYDVTGPQFEAPGGIRVGDPRATVEERYDGNLTVTPHKYVDGADVLTVESPTGGTARLIFEMTPEGIVERWRLGVPPGVDFVEGCQ